MNLLIVNGSPRGESGSTAMLLTAFENGVSKHGSVTVTNLVLKHKNNAVNFVEAFQNADAVILAYPLYTDAMPALTKMFVESLQPLIGTCAGKPLGFIVQSGFPEACQSRPAERYNEKLARRLGCAYAGCVIRGNCNRLELQPRFVKRPIFKTLEKLGERFVSDSVLDRTMIQKLATPERFGGFSRWMMRILAYATPLTNLYWDRELKKNGVFKEKNRLPYSV